MLRFLSRTKTAMKTALGRPLRDDELARIVKRAEKAKAAAGKTIPAPKPAKPAAPKAPEAGKPAPEPEPAKTAARNTTSTQGIALYAAAIEQGEIERIEPLLRQQIAENPLSADAIGLLARCRLRLSDYAAAAPLYAEAESLRGYSKTERREWAEALDGMGRSDEARSLLLSAIRQNPTSWELYWDYAALVETQDHYAPLRDHCRDLIAQRPVSDAIERALAKAATLVDDFDTAYAIYRRLIAIATQKEIAAAAKAKGGVLPKIEKVKSNDLAGGKGERCLIDFKAALEGIDVPFFLMAGTVLGYIRDGRLLEGDKDVDVGIFEKDYDKPRIEAALRASAKFQIKRVDDHADRIRAVHRNGVWIDVFPYYTEGHRTWHAGTVARWWHEPFDLKPYVVADTEFMIPADTEAYLEWNYGPDWRIPYSLFDVYNDAPNAEVMRPDFLLYSTWRKIFEGLKVRDWEKVLKYVTKDPSLIDANPWLFKLRLLAEQQLVLVPPPERVAVVPAESGGEDAEGAVDDDTRADDDSPADDTRADDDAPPAPRSEGPAA